MLSAGGRLILVNSCLSNQPNYTMTFYSLKEETHRKIDSIRARFFWRGANDNFKYHMVKWDAMCRPKDYGGLGVLNTRLMNDCLLSKWFWRMSRAKDELWYRILKAKYFSRGEMGAGDSMTARGSQFWKSLQVVKHLFKTGGGTSNW